MTKVEQVARAIIDAIKAEDGGAMVATDEGWTGIDCHVRIDVIARAAIAAMDPPTEGTMNAGIAYLGSINVRAESSASIVLGMQQAIIAAALEEQA